MVALGPSRAPLDLALKHTYDWEVRFTHPRLVAFRVPTAVRRAPSASGLPALVAHARRRLLEGGAWKSAQRHLSRNLQGRFVLDGDWDLAKQPFEPLPSLVEMFHHGVDHRDTREYQVMHRAVRAGDFRWTKGCTTEEEVEAYFGQLTDVFDDIRAGGYRTQRELGIPGDDEIRVCVDRDGRLAVIGGGTHRLTIATLLDLERIPVVVKRVHGRWVEACLRRYGDDARQAIARGLDAVLSAEPDGSAR